MADLEKTLLASLDAFLGFARKRLNDPELAADAVQESLLKALKSAEPPQDEEKVVPWFYTILRRSIIDLYRRNAARGRALDALAHQFPEHPGTEEATVICSCFKALLPTLPEQYQIVLQRIDLDGQSGKEVAAELDLTPNNLQVRLHRARKLLRSRLEEMCRACAVHGCLDCACAE